MDSAQNQGQGQGDAQQVLCQRCRGGNPPTATVCMWCGQTIVAPTPGAEASQQQVAESYEAENLRAKVQQILMQGERLEYIAVESKPVQINIAPDAVVLTNRRFIIYRPRVFGQVEFEDYIWRDLHDAQLREGMLRATFSVMTTDGRRIEVSDLPKDQARRVYQFAQQMEEYVLEERRIREMEEKRAASGAIYMNTPPMPAMPTLQPQPTMPTSQPAPATPPQESPVEKLRQLKEMLDAGLITNDIYEAKRNEILSKM